MTDDRFRRRNPRPPAVPRAGTDAPRTGSDPGPGPGPAGPGVTEVAPPRDPIMRWLVIAIAACLVGCAVLLVLNGPELLTATAIVLGGIAFVLVLAAGFYAVGRSEDRERAALKSGPDGPAV